MDSLLDIKFKNLMNEYYPNKEEKVNPFYFSKSSKPFLFKKRKLKKHKSYIILANNTNINNKDKFKSSNNIIDIRFKSAKRGQNKNIIKLNTSKVIPLSISNSGRNTNLRIYNKENILISTDILKDKAFSKLGIGQLSINSLVNQIKENKFKKIRCIKKNLSDVELNQLHNLQLTSSKERTFFKKLTKFAMLNNLYHKYSSTSSGNLIKKKDSNNNDKYYKKKDKNELPKGNSPVYLTNLASNKNFNFYNIYKRNLNSVGNQKNNNIIIDRDRKIYIDCLKSRVESELNAKKIFPKINGKTIYNLQKEIGYIRIQNLDNIFSEIMKK